MKEVVEKLINSSIAAYNMIVFDAFYSKEEGNKVFNIVLDSDEVIDSEKITGASRIINKIMDETKEIPQDYDVLDIYSKEKGEDNEQ